ncbi:cell division protein FtsL [Fictibacillus sp. WQ 8-8]|uniref:Cell division protein FtsL n=1 Tax=Fictibacillus marinisediminis TaxID=2878389 RepID=A0A9X1XA65_9BACL|nr:MULTISPECIES: cell division protein FtsL [Fictibacillus]MCK6256911.1 cell division protein FtsL [Fictibacillus marinisediminis]MCQ6265692.1 cell division protein FtsL [Fictibacillus sp. WQ 8-8]MED2973426.1 cell division protein FtsL [Fictibacillus sp. B-59209]SFD85573.1 cell division protein FtsL [Bacillus sp. OV194]
MSNLAYQTQRQYQQESKQKYVQQQAQPRIRTPRITKGEKFLWVFASLMLIAGAIFMVSNYASIYKVNSSIESVQSSINYENKVVDDYKQQVTELSAPDRILKIAKEKLGMTLNDKNVKVLEN